jgi:hypothetical protein
MSVEHPVMAVHLGPALAQAVAAPEVRAAHAALLWPSDPMPVPCRPAVAQCAG